MKLETSEKFVLQSEHDKFIFILTIEEGIGVLCLFFES